MNLNCILLVDDDHPTNVYHRIMLEEAGINTRVEVANNGLQAIEYIKGCPPNGDNLLPDLILLDINMPMMTGFEFMEAYNQLEEHLRTGVVIMMLTTSLSSVESRKAAEVGNLRSFEIKPLTIEMIDGIMQRYFA